MGSEKKSIYYELLVLRCQRKDKGSLEELIHLFEKQIFCYTKRLVENKADAWNTLQETWIKVIRSIKQIRESKSLPTWLYSIARKTAISHLRSKYSKEAFIDCSTDITKIEGGEKGGAGAFSTTTIHVLPMKSESPKE